MKRLLAAFLALMLCALPVMGSAEDFAATDTALPRLINCLAELAERKNPQLTVTLTNAADMTFSAVLGQAEGAPAAALSFPGAELIVSGLMTALTRWDGSYSVSTPELLTALTAVPELGEKDLDALKAFGYSLLGRLSRQAVSYSLSSNMLSLHINVDALLQDLDTAMPELLRLHADALNPLVSGVTGMLLSQRLTCSDLADLWPMLGLSGLRTGIEADVAVLKMGSAVNVSVFCMGHTLTLSIENDTTMSFSLLPAGAEQAYVLDTRDLLTVVEILMAIPTYSVTEDDFDDVTTIDVAVTRQAILDALSRNGLTVDMLLYKYDPWFQLLSGKKPAAETITTDGAAAAAATTGYSQMLDLEDLLRIVSRLPETVFALHWVRNDDDRTINASGELMGLDYTFDWQEGRYGNATTWHAAIQDRNLYTPLDIRISGLQDYAGNFTASLSSTKAIFGAYAINLSVQNRVSLSSRRRIRGNQIALTTDTDAFHFLYKDAYGSLTELDVRLGDVSFAFDHPYRSASMSATLDIGGFLVNASASDAHVNISSELFGLDVLGTENGGVMTGYLVDGYDVYAFTLQQDMENELLTLNLMLDGDSLYLACQPDELKLRMDGEELALRKIADGTWHMLVSGELFATLLTERSTRANHFRFRLLPGDGTAGDGVTLLIRFDADPIVLPADAKPCTPEEFLQVLQSTFQPAESAVDAVPLAEEAPQP